MTGYISFFLKMQYVYLIGWCSGEEWFYSSCFHLQENNTMVNLAIALENEGISAFRLDFAGNG